MRRCPQCGESYGPEGFYSDKRREDGLDFYCKQCRLGRSAELRAKRAAARPPKPVPSEKECTRCHVVKPLKEFYNRKGEGKQYPKCRDCRLAIHQEYVSRPEVAEKLREYERNRREKKWKRPPRREPHAPGFEVCTMCNEDKPFDQFHKHKLGRNGLDSVCRPCRSVRSKERRKDPSVREREHRQKVERTFKMSRGFYDQMLASQGGVCAICGMPPTKERLHVDHCHNTGSVRGLLCYSCNAGLGSFKDAASLLEAAIGYLDKPPATPLRHPSASPNFL